MPKIRKPRKTVAFYAKQQETFKRATKQITEQLAPASAAYARAKQLSAVADNDMRQQKQVFAQLAKQEETIMGQAVSMLIDARRRRVQMPDVKKVVFAYWNQMIAAQASAPCSIINYWRGQHTVRELGHIPLAQLQTLATEFTDDSAQWRSPDGMWGARAKARAPWGFADGATLYLWIQRVDAACEQAHWE